MPTAGNVLINGATPSADNRVSVVFQGIQFHALVYCTRKCSSSAYLQRYVKERTQ
nr:hypothetical protein [Candidatus Brachybacter algidus]